MAFSQNGYPANSTSFLDWYTVPGSKVRFQLAKGAPAQVLCYLASRFDDEVEDIDTAGSYIADGKPSIPGGEPSTLADDWSYAPRPIRGSTTTLSNHASGTAIDLNATQHPRGKRGTYTAEQVKRVRAIVADLRDPKTGRPVVRWGEDYTTAPVDGMHFEIDADLSAVKRVAAQLDDPLEAVMGWYKDRAEFEGAGIRANVRNAPLTLRTGKTVTVEDAIAYGVAISTVNQQHIYALERLVSELAAKAGMDQAAVAKALAVTDPTPLEG